MTLTYDGSKEGITDTLLNNGRGRVVVIRGKKMGVLEGKGLKIHKNPHVMESVLFNQVYRNITSSTPGFSQ